MSQTTLDTEIDEILQAISKGDSVEPLKLYLKSLITRIQDESIAKYMNYRILRFHEAMDKFGESITAIEKFLTTGQPPSMQYIEQYDLENVPIRNPKTVQEIVEAREQEMLEKLAKEAIPCESFRRVKGYGTVHSRQAVPVEIIRQRAKEWRGR